MFSEIALSLLAKPVFAVTTGTVITAVGEGLNQGADAGTEMLGDNIATPLIVFGLITGIYLLMRIFRRSAR